MASAAPAAAEHCRSATEARSPLPPVIIEEPHDPRDADPHGLGEDEGRAALGPRGALRVRAEARHHSRHDLDRPVADPGVADRAPRGPVPRRYRGYGGELDAGLLPV